MGHCGGDAMKSLLKEMFSWDNMDRDVERFVSQCGHCIFTRSGALIPRPLATELQGTKPHEVLHMDFLYMWQGVYGVTSRRFTVHGCVLS